MQITIKTLWREGGHEILRAVVTMRISVFNDENPVELSSACQTIGNKNINIVAVSLKRLFKSILITQFI